VDPESAVTLLLTEDGTGPAIRLVPIGGSASNVLVDLRADNPIDGLYPVRLLEDSEYVYEVLGLGKTESIQLEPAELFFPDPDQVKRGRLRTASYVGVLPIEIASDGARHRSVVEVQSRKLDYFDEYRWMVRDLTDEVTSLVLERFAPTRQRLVDDWAREPKTAYERFIHLQAHFADPSFERAVLHVTNRPYVEWVEQTALRLPNQPIRGGSRLARAISRPGPRIEWPGGTNRTLPATIAVDVTVTDGRQRAQSFRKARFGSFLEAGEPSARFLDDAAGVGVSTAGVARGRRSRAAARDLEVSSNLSRRWGNGHSARRQSSDP